MTGTTKDLLGEALVALRRAREDYYAALPEFPADGACPMCGSSEFLQVEEGYARITRGEWVPASDHHLAGHLHLSTDGWDDFSEDGEFQVTECAACPATFKAPPAMEWD